MGAGTVAAKRRRRRNKSQDKSRRWEFWPVCFAVFVPLCGCDEPPQPCHPERSEGSTSGFDHGIGILRFAQTGTMQSRAESPESRAKPKGDFLSVTAFDGLVSQLWTLDWHRSGIARCRAALRRDKYVSPTVQSRRKASTSTSTRRVRLASGAGIVSLRRNS